MGRLLRAIWNAATQKDAQCPSCGEWLLFVAESNTVEDREVLCVWCGLDVRR